MKEWTGYGESEKESGGRSGVLVAVGWEEEKRFVC